VTGPSRIRAFLRRHLTPDQRRFVKFLVVGGSGVPVNLGAVFVATAVLPGSLSADVRDTTAYFAGIALSIFTNFLLNNCWTWGDRTTGRPGGFLARLGKFYLVSAAAALVQLATSAILSGLMRGTDFFSLPIHGEYRVYHVLAPLAGILLGLAINFGVNDLWTFRRTPGRTDPRRPGPSPGTKPDQPP